MAQSVSTTFPTAEQREQLRPAPTTAIASPATGRIHLRTLVGAHTCVAFVSFRGLYRPPIAVTETY